ncbi:unnamed protein product [Prorocentrum cordatum]|uniref:Uncharacterized protein n=1 Tax=Prorocentrum cordatum TaxID=2364126 RepID=A0ABN9XAW2_9DINO|nr:unnamed protein product [Polarella glacialis]
MSATAAAEEEEEEEEGKEQEQDEQQTHNGQKLAIGPTARALKRPTAVCGKPLGTTPRSWPKWLCITAQTQDTPTKPGSRGARREAGGQGETQHGRVRGNE